MWVEVGGHIGGNRWGSSYGGKKVLEYPGGIVGRSRGSRRMVVMGGMVGVMGGSRGSRRMVVMGGMVGGMVEGYRQGVGGLGGLA